jgi:hypothetical protein
MGKKVVSFAWVITDIPSYGVCPGHEANGDDVSTRDGQSVDGTFDIMARLIPINLLDILVIAFQHGLSDDVGVVNFVDDNPHVIPLRVESIKLLTLLCQGMNRDLFIVREEPIAERRVVVHGI